MDTFIQKKIEEFRKRYFGNLYHNFVDKITGDNVTGNVSQILAIESFLILALTEQKEMLRKEVKKIPTEDHSCIEDYKSEVLKILE